MALLLAARAQRQAKLQAALEELMTLVVRTINEKKDHIPPVVSSAVLTFSFDISIAGCGSNTRMCHRNEELCRVIQPCLLQVLISGCWCAGLAAIAGWHPSLFA